LKGAKRGRDTLNSRHKLLAALFLAIISMSLFSIFAQSANIMLAELISSESNKESENPAIAIDNIDRLHMVWEESGSTSSSLTGQQGLPETGHDSDIFYKYKKNSSLAAKTYSSTEGRIVGGLQIVSNDSAMQSQRPAIATDSRGLAHIVWEELAQPIKIIADANTTFLVRFDGSTDANYSAGTDVPSVQEDITFNNDGAINKSVTISTLTGRLVYPASGNVNNNIGTVEFWFRPEYTSKDHGLLSSTVLFQLYNSDTEKITARLIISKNRFYLKTSINNDNDNGLLFAPADRFFPWSKNEWHHFALTYDFDANRYKMYADGDLIAQNLSAIFIQPALSSGNITLGNTVGRNAGTKTTIDEFRIMSNVLSAAEIKEDASNRSIQYKRVNISDDEKGPQWSAQEQVSLPSDTNLSYAPSIALGADNSIYVVWNSMHNTSSMDVLYRRKNTTSWSNIEVVSNVSKIALMPDIAVDNRNASLVVWQDFTNASLSLSMIVFANRSSTGVWSDYENVSNVSHASDDPADIINWVEEAQTTTISKPRIILDNQSRVHIAWSDTNIYPRDNLIFFAPYDRDFNATIAGGNGTGFISSGTTPDILRGRNATEYNIVNYDSLNGAFINETDYLNYSSAGNFNASMGAIAAWIKLDWNASMSLTDLKTHTILAAQSEDTSISDSNIFQFGIIANSGTLYLLMLIRDSSGTAFAVSGGNSNLSEWNYREWHHVGASWNVNNSLGQREIDLFVDGVEVTNVSITPDSTAPIDILQPTRLIIGADYDKDNELYRNQLNGTIDDLMIFNTTMEAWQFNALKDHLPVILHRRKDNTGWSRVNLVSNQSKYAALVPNLAESGNRIYLTWAEEFSPYTFNSTDYRYGGFSKIQYAIYNKTSARITNLGTLNDESLKDASNPDITANESKIYFIWEDDSEIMGTDSDIYFREITNTSLPLVAVGYPAGGETFTGDFIVNATAADEDSTINNLTFYYTGNNGLNGEFICDDATSPYSCTWKIASVSEDYYSVKVIANSDDGGRGTNISKLSYIDSNPNVRLYRINESGNTLGNHKAFQRGYLEANETKANISLGTEMGSEASQQQLTAASSSDANYWNTSLKPTSCQGQFYYYNNQIFKFIINESADDISSMKMNWRGYGQINGLLSDMNTSIFIWNSASGIWELIYEELPTEVKDIAVSHTISSNFGNYLNGTDNAFFILAQTREWALCIGGGCPRYSSWNSITGKYEFESDGIIGMLNSKMNKKTYDRLDMLTASRKAVEEHGKKDDASEEKEANPENDSDKIRIMISENAPETAFMDYSSLIIATHPERTQVLLDSSGIPHTIREEDIQGVQCRDKARRDCTALVASADDRPRIAAPSTMNGLAGGRSPADIHHSEKSWVSDISSIDPWKTASEDNGKKTSEEEGSSVEDDGLEDYIEITLPENRRNSKMAKLIVSASETGFKSFAENEIAEILKKVLGYGSIGLAYSLQEEEPYAGIVRSQVRRSNMMSIKMKDEEERWMPYPGLEEGASDYKTMVFPINLSLLNDDRLRIQTGTLTHYIDHVGIDYAPDEEVTLKTVQPRQQELSEMDDRKEIIISYPDSIGLVFDPPQVLDEERSKSRTYFLATAGYYHPGELESQTDNDENLISKSVARAKALAALLKNNLSRRMILEDSFGERYLLDRYIHLKNASFNMSSNPENARMNTMYTNMISVVVSTCTIPFDGMTIAQNTSLCPGIYNIPNDDPINNPAVVRITGKTGLRLNCNGATLIGGCTEPEKGQCAGSGVGIGINYSTDIEVTNCNITGYEIAIGANASSGIMIKDSEVRGNYVGIGFEGTNSSTVRNNTISESGYVGFGGVLYNYNDIVINNSFFKNFVAIGISNTYSSAFENNYINQSCDRISSGDYACSRSTIVPVGAIAVQKNSNGNTIKNNTIFGGLLGIGLVDASIIIPGSESLPSGIDNNFSRNAVNGTALFGIGILSAYNQDYYNYFGQDNTVNGEITHYYYNTHGTSASYTNIWNLTLTGKTNEGDGTGYFIGKVTIVNSSFINVGNNTLANNFYGVLIINSSNITVWGNKLQNNSAVIAPSFGGAGLFVMDSRKIDIFNNNASLNMMGYYLKDSTLVNLTNNTAILNKYREDVDIDNLWNYGQGFRASNVNDSYFLNNTADSNNASGMLFTDGSNTSVNGNTALRNLYGIQLDSSNVTLISNTMTENTMAGLMLKNTENNTYSDDYGNVIFNNTGAGVLFFSAANSNISSLISYNNSIGFHYYDSIGLISYNLNASRNAFGYLFNTSYDNKVLQSTVINSTEADFYFSTAMNNTIIDSYTINNGTGNATFSRDASSNTLLNVTFNKSSYGFEDDDSNLTVRWHLDFLVQDNESVLYGMNIPISGVNISVVSALGVAESTFTDAYGYAFLNATDYVQNKSAKQNMNNYTWNVSKSGYNFTGNLASPYVVSANMTINRAFNLSMLLAGGVEDVDPPTAPIVVDGPNYVDLDWTSNRTALTASWYNSTDRSLIFYSYRIFDNGTCLTGYCGETSASQSTQVTVGGLTLQEGHNYTFAVRARDTKYFFSPYTFSDGITADFTAPNVTVNSSTHPNESQWYSNNNVTLIFSATDALSGVETFSYLLDASNGTGPDFVAETVAPQSLKTMKNTGDKITLKTNGTGTARAIFIRLINNLTVGDVLSLSFAATEDTQDTTDKMTVLAYAIPGTTTLASVDHSSQAISQITNMTADITSRAYRTADTYTADITITTALNGSFYVVLAGSSVDDDNTYNLSLAASTTDLDTSVEKTMCIESGGCSNITSTRDVAVSINLKSNASTRTKTYTNLADGEHWFHARAQDKAGNWGEPRHFRLGIDAVNGTPIFTLVRPRGFIATTSPTLTAVLSERTTCYANTTNASGVRMTSFDGLRHELDLSLSEGTHTYGFNCTDTAGNRVFNTTTFTINRTVIPDTITISAIGIVPALSAVSATINASRVFEGSGYGVGELAKSFTFNITNSSSVTTAIFATVVDMGEGIYRVTFLAPSTAGDYTLRAAVNGITDTEDFTVASSTLTIKFTKTLPGPNKQARLAFSTIGKDYTVGLGSDEYSASTTGTTTSLLKLAYAPANGNAFIIVTNSLGDVGKIAEFLNDASFLDLSEPAFGYALTDLENTAMAALSYDQIDIIGSEDLPPGRHSLLVKNSGVNSTSGRTMITVSAIS